MKARASSPISLPTALIALVLSGILIFTAAAVLVVRERVTDFQDAALEEAVQLRTRGGALAFARALERDWSRLDAIVTNLPQMDQDTLGAVLGITAGPDKDISWAGYADTDGTVLTASGFLLEGADISQRPWFRNGLQGNFAGDMHEAVLLADLIGSEDGAPLRFLDMAMPVRDSAGRTTGVLGFHINAAWAETFLTEFARAAEIDLLLVNAQGEVVVTTDDIPEGPLDLPSLRAAADGVQSSSYETWPDGTRYFTSVVPDISYGELPSFGWRLVGRVEPETFPATRGAELVRSIIALLLGAGTIFLLVAFLFNRIYLRPIGRLARNAQRIADGADEYPLEIGRTQELRRLSQALAKLEAQRGI